MTVSHDFHALAIADLRRETADAISLGLAVPDHLREAYRFKPGQHVAVRAALDGEEVRRTYSICSGPDDAHLRIAIKRLPDGRFSVWAHATLKPGMTLEAMPPTGRFMLPESDGAPRHILAVAAGAGITPVMAMLRHGLTREPATRFTLLYGNRTSDDIIFREALEDLKDRHLGRLSVMSVLSREEGDAPLLAGRITPEKLGQVMGRQLPPALIAHAFLCGPGDMIRDLRNALLALGLPRERVHHEFFAPAGGARRPAPPLPASDRSQAAPGTGTDLTVVLDGVRHRLEARLGEPVLEAAIRAGLRVPYSCRGGMCCTCRARLVEGEAEMLVNYSLEPWEIERRFTLTCQAVPRSPRLVVDYDQM